MFTTCSATKVSMAPMPPDQRFLRKTGISKKKKKKKKIFLPQNDAFSQYRKNSLFNENNTVTHKIMQTQPSFEQKAHRYGQKKRPTL